MSVLADGRRGLAAGLGLVAVGFTAIAWADGAWVGGAFLVIGGAVAVIALLRAGPQDWGIMPAGSTPRLILAAPRGGAPPPGAGPPRTRAGGRRRVSTPPPPAPFD